MSIESAEMTKHALNAFLATSVVFINEIASLCEQVGANAREVELGLKSEERIGAKAYLRPGNAIAGGTLARDVNYLIQMGQQNTLETPLFSALLTSNHAHKQWSCRRMMDILKELKNKTIATLGLTYKAGTDTLRRSSAVEMCQWLANQGARVLAYDPAVKVLPAEFTSFIQLKNTLTETLQNADAVVIATEWPEFNALSVEQLLAAIKQPYVFDAGGFLAKSLGNDERIKYFSVGRHL
jgi:UDPglucose 6-dehydrogenase